MKTSGICFFFFFHLMFVLRAAKPADTLLQGRSSLWSVWPCQPNPELHLPVHEGLL